MMDGIRQWLFSLVAVSLLTALIQTLTPKGTMRRICGFTGGLALLLCVLRPISGTRLEESVAAFSAYETQQRAVTEEYVRENERTIERIIEEETATYISDKARELRLDCVAEVTAYTSDGVALPYSVTITGAYSEVLARHIEAALFVPRERQRWIEPQDGAIK